MEDLLPKTESKYPIKWGDISPWFSVEEIMSPDTMDYLHLVDIKALTRLNEFRQIIDKPIFVNHSGLHLRGVRSSREQLSLKEVGGARYSQHVQGKAFDMSCYAMNWSEFVTACKNFWTFSKQYPDMNFVHGDDRNLIAL